MKKDDAVDTSCYPGKSSRLPGMTAPKPRPRHPRTPRGGVCLLLIALTGCSAQGALTAASTAADVAPKVIGGAEQLKTSIEIAPLSNCVSLLQQTQLQLQALQNGTPGIPVSPSPTVPPILSTPPPPTYLSPSTSHSPRPISLHKQIAGARLQAEWIAVQRVGRAAYERRQVASLYR